MAGDPDGNGIVADIVERCGRLPLAIRIAAARYRVSATHRLADVKADLMDAHRALSVLDDGERSVAASISMSVADLPETLRTALVALAAHPGSDIEGRAAAAAIGTDTAHAAWCLDQLADRHLMTWYRPGRYRFHDLIRAYARDRIPPAEPGGTGAVLRRKPGMSAYEIRVASPTSFASPPRPLPRITAIFGLRLVLAEIAPTAAAVSRVMFRAP